MKFLWHQILYRPLFNALILIYLIIPDLGVSIIILSVIIKLILHPTQAKALRSQKRLQELQPELQKIQTKYKNDKQKQSKAMMEFYQTHRVNPFSSCLPQLVQFPVLIAMYQVFRTGLDNSHLNEIYSFIAKPENINPIFLGHFNLAQPDKYILPILAGVSQFIYSKLLMPATQPSKKGQSGASTQEMISRQMIYLMPVMVVFFAMKFPAALSLYWVVSSVFGIFQQLYINRQGAGQGVRLKVKTKERKK